MTVHDIKKMFNLLEIKDEKGNIIQKEQYKNGSDFKKRVLDKAKNDIRKLYEKGLCDVCFDYKVKSKNSRGAVTAYYFIIETMVILQDLVQRSRLHQHRLRFCQKVMVQN